MDHEAVSLFVENLPKALHWKGLWHAFARHGDVLYAFIARKLSREGRRFGFVRMKTRTDALRTIERLDGFTFYGYRLTVKLARFQPVQHGRIFWRKNETSILNRDAQDHVLRKEDGVSSNQSRMELKRIPGYVEEDGSYGNCVKSSVNLIKFHITIFLSSLLNCFSSLLSSICLVTNSVRSLCRNSHMCHSIAGTQQH
ncbi:hypothetical protein GQ457_15G025860 [Hibiscus cannabinus]